MAVLVCIIQTAAIKQPGQPIPTALGFGERSLSLGTGIHLASLNHCWGFSLCFLGFKTSSISNQVRLRRVSLNTLQPKWRVQATGEGVCITGNLLKLQSCLKDSLNT